MKERTRRRLHSLAVVLALVASTSAVYLQALDHDFVSYDDAREIFENPKLQQALTAANVARPFTEPFFFNWIPLTYLSFHLDHALHGSGPGGFILTNVVLHATSAVLLFLVFQSLTGAIGPSAFVAGVFALHPLHVESVAWISERKDVLSGLFWMLTLFFYGRYAASPSVLRYLCVALGLVLGLLSKPMVVTLPFVLILLDYWPLGRMNAGRSGTPARSVPIPRLLAEKLPLVALATVSSIITYRVQSASGAVSAHSIPWDWRIQNALEAYGTYLLQTVWPVGLAAIYPLPAERPGWEFALLSTLLLAVLSWLTFWQRRARPFLACGWLWFLGTLVPVIGVVQVGLHAHADRYMYLPMIGVLIALAWGAQDVAARWPIFRRLQSGLAIVAIVALGLIAHRQVGYWSDSRSLFERALAVVEDNYFAHDAMATLLLKERLVDEAEGHYREAARLNSRWFSPELGMGNVFLERDRPDLAIPHFERATQLAPDNALPHANLGKAWASMGRPKSALPHLSRALDLERGFGRSRILALHAETLALLGKRDEAIGQYAAALDLDPSFGSAHANRAVLLVEAGRTADAASSFERAIALGLESSLIHSMYADVLASMNEPARAAAHYRRALQIEPGPATANNLAWLLATTDDASVRDSTEAIRIAEALAGAAEAQSRADPTLLDTLAVAYAASGRHEDAIRAASQAATKAEADGDIALGQEIRRRLSLYRDQRPQAQEAHKTPPARARTEDRKSVEHQ